MCSVVRSFQVLNVVLLWLVNFLHRGHGGDTTSPERDRLLYHPGHPPFHVMRLSRFDKASGMDAFIESEERWRQAGGTEQTAPSRRRALVPITDGVFANVVGSSKSKRKMRDAHDDLEAPDDLQEHSLIQTASSESEFEDSSLDDQNSPREIHEAAQSPRRFPPEKMVPKRFDPHLKPSRIVPQRFSNIGALYVAPIGVGSKPATDLNPKGPELKQKVSALTQTGEGIEEDATMHQAELWVVYDTGSTNIWISSDLCRWGPCAKEGRVRYNHTQSPTFSWQRPKTLLTVEFGTGKLEGPLGQDHMHIGPARVKDQVFALIEKQTGSVFEFQPFEGIVGLSFPTLATASAPPFFDNLIKQNVLPHNEFSMYLSQKSDAANAILWGGVDPMFFNGKIEYFPVVDPYYWSLELHSFQIGDTALLGYGASNAASLMEWPSLHRPTVKPPPGPKAIVDSGTTLLTAEPALYKQIKALLPDTECANINATSHPPLTYILRNSAGELRPIVVHNSQYMLASRGGKCSLGFMKVNLPKAHGPGMMFGEVFLKHYYTVFDRQDGDIMKGRVGFAPSVHTDNVLDHLRNLTKSQPSYVEARIRKSTRTSPS